jgi:CheY-like chemotaxis protein/nitrogen-specific signal transduction histidine kinase
VSSEEHLLDEDWLAREADELRRARAANDQRARFLATASHEIRTPLAAMIGLADLLLGEPLTPAQMTYAHAIRTSGEALMSLVDDVLDVSRIEAGRLDLKPSPTDVAPLLESLIELVAPRAQAKGLELALRMTQTLPSVAVDAGRLRQVLLNLVGNAVKFTEVGGVELAVACEAAPEGIARLRFTVTDTGPGVAEADQARIFCEYEQAESGPARRHGGTGLGLPIAAAIVEAMGGRIALSSRPGGGAAFTFALDLPRLGEATTQPLLAGQRLLILSPTRFEAPALADALGLVGAEAIVAESLWDARQALAQKRFDSLLIDHGDDEAARVLAELGDITPPAIVMIRPADRQDLPRLKAAGFIGHLVKPVRSASLVKVVEARLRDGEVASDAAPIPASTGRLDADILMAEDDDINALLGRTLLARLGARVDVVGDGEAAIAAARARLASGRPYDLVLMDMHMPGMDGAEAIAVLRGLDSARRMRILALTADPTGATEEAALAAGADGRLLKPLDAAALLAAAQAAPNA